MILVIFFNYVRKVTYNFVLLFRRVYPLRKRVYTLKIIYIENMIITYFLKISCGLKMTICEKHLSMRGKIALIAYYKPGLSYMVSK